ncbi:MAG: Nif-specific regulatory protein, partial [Bradymonadia bacterium]
MTGAAAQEYAAAVLARALAPSHDLEAVPRLKALAHLRLDEHVDLEDVLQRIVDEVVRRLGADRGTLYLVDHARGELVSHVARLPELAEIRLRVGEGIAGWVAQTGESVMVPDGPDDARFEPRIDTLTGYTTDTILAVPIRRADDAVIGVVQVLNKVTGLFDRSDRDRLQALAAEIAGILDRTSLRSQLRPSAARPLEFRFNHIV